MQGKKRAMDGLKMEGLGYSWEVEGGNILILVCWNVLYQLFVF